MTTNFLKKSLLSLTASSLLVTGLSADIAPKVAKLDLETYSRIIVEFNSTVAGTGFDTAGESNFTIENNTTDDNLTLAFVFADTNRTIYSIAGGKESGTGNTLIAADAVKKIRGNTQNGLKLLWDYNTSASTADDVNISLTTTIGTLTVVDDKWNLVTMPTGITTNAKEIIKSGKATMIWGWEYNSSNEYNWESYPSNMTAGKGYWIRTRITANTSSTLGDIVASDYNTSVKSDISTITADINTSNFVDVVSKIPNKEEWVLLGNSGVDATIISTTGSENNTSTYFFEDLLNSTNNCYFVSIYHWNSTSSTWVNDTEGGATTTVIPANAGVWVKQRLCDK